MKTTQARYKEKKGREYIWSVNDFRLAGSLLSNEIIRVRFLRSSQFDEACYQLVDGQEGTLPYHSWIVTKGDEEWPDTISDKEARTALEPYLQGFAFSPSTLRLIRPLSDTERIYGLGEHTGEMNKRGKSFAIWNVDPPLHHSPETENMYTSIPFYLGIQPQTGIAYGVLIDHTGLVEIDMGKTNPTEATISVQGDTLVVYYLGGPTPEAVMRQYTQLTGKMPLPPRWSIGYHQCRWSYNNETEVRQLATRLREGNHPCDTIWLDIDYMKGFRNFTWDPEKFPDPQQLIEDLHLQGLRLVTIIDPGTKIDEQYFVYQQGLEQDYFCRYLNGEIFNGSVWPGASVFPDFSRREVRAWWGDLYKGLLDLGVDGIWNDMNEPALTNINLENEAPMHGTTMSNAVFHQADSQKATGPDGPPVLHSFFHNAYGMVMARSSYEGLLRLRPNERPFVLTRSGTAGIQRYAALWTGDNTSKWEHIQMAISMCLNISMSGIPFIGADIGGFWDASNGELLVRFAQLGALLPFCRNHNAIYNPDQEPWAFGEPYESAYRKAIETRYRLLPYLYTLFHEASSRGNPVIRPLYYHYPLDEQAYIVEDEFLIGNTLLSAPISTAGATSRNVYLPEGIWFDYWTGKKYAGNSLYEIEAPLESWPLLVRGNSILPSGPVMQYTDQAPTDPLTITCYMPTDGLVSSILYEDDGKSQEYRNGAFANLIIQCHTEGELVRVEIEEQFSRYRPKREWYEIIVHTASRTLEQRVPAGQGKVAIHW